MPDPTILLPARQTPDLRSAPAEGPVAFGGDLAPRSLLRAYRSGLYPFPADALEHRLFNELTYEDDVAAGRVALLDGPVDPYSLAWCSPDPRPVIEIGEARVQRSLRQQLRKVDWTTTLDRCFERVVLACRAGRDQRLLTDDLVAGLLGLHAAGRAHSVEVWDGTELVGGTFGVRVGRVFSADSQFTRRSGAGKVAVVDLLRRFAHAGGSVVDVQHDSDHSRLLGAGPMPRSRYLALLSDPAPETALPTGAQPAARLAETTATGPGGDGS